MIGCKCSFVPVAIVIFGLPVTGASVHCEEYCRRTEAVDSFVRAGNGIQIADRYGSRHTLVDAEGQ